MTLKLEGKLAEVWVEELEKTWLEVSQDKKIRRVVVDLSDVSFVDACGEMLLGRMYYAGTALMGATPYIQDVLRHITENYEP